MKITPLNASKIIKKPLKKINNKNIQNHIVDLSQEENGHYRVGNQLIKVIFPR